MVVIEVEFAFAGPKPFHERLEIRVPRHSQPLRRYRLDSRESHHHAGSQKSQHCARHAPSTAMSIVFLTGSGQQPFLPAFHVRLPSLLVASSTGWRSGRIQQHRDSRGSRNTRSSDVSPAITSPPEPWRLWPDVLRGSLGRSHRPEPRRCSKRLPVPRSTHRSPTNCYSMQ